MGRQAIDIIAELLIPIGHNAFICISFLKQLRRLRVPHDGKITDAAICISDSGITSSFCSNKNTKYIIVHLLLKIDIHVLLHVVSTNHFPSSVTSLLPLKLS